MTGGHVTGSRGGGQGMAGGGGGQGSGGVAGGHDVLLPNINNSIGRGHADMSQWLYLLHMMPASS